MTSTGLHLDPSRIDVGSADALLTTTRSIRRRLDLDRDVDPELIEQALQVAVHAPTASNKQTWRWLVVTEPRLKEVIAEHYRLAWGHYRSLMSAGRRRRFAAASPADDSASRRTQRSAEFLAENLQRVPVLVIPCVQGRVPDANAVNEQWLAKTRRFGNRAASTTRATSQILKPSDWSSWRASSDRSTPRCGRSSSHCGPEGSGHR